MKRLMIAGALLVCCATVPLWVKRQEARERQLVEAAVARALQEHSEVDLRPVLRGEALAGRARDAYNRAIAEVNSLGFEAGFVCAVHRSILSHKAEDRRAVQDCLKRAEAALSHLAEGARCRDAGRSMRRREDAPQDASSLLGFRELINLTALKVAERHLAGDEASLEASFLDGLQISGDFMRSPFSIEEMIGCSGVAILCSVIAFGDDRSGEGAPYVIDATKLSSESKGRLSQGVREFVAALPRTTCVIEAEAVSFWQEFLAQEDKGRDASFWPLWDDKAGLISREAYVARGVREALALGAAFRAKVADPEVDEFRILGELRRGRSPSNSRVFAPLDFPWETTCLARQGTILQLWLLIAALEFPGNTDSQTLSLPYGLEATLHRDSQGELRFDLSKSDGPVPEHLQRALENFLR